MKSNLERSRFHKARSGGLFFAQDFWPDDSSYDSNYVVIVVVIVKKL